MMRHIPLMACSVCLILGIRGEVQLSSQALPTATGPGGYITVGGSVAAYHSPYNEHVLGGYSIFVDGNATRALGVEAEIRRLQVHADEGTRVNTYLVGPRVCASWMRYRPYAKLLVGSTSVIYPFAYAHGSYFTIAPGMGIDINVLHGRANIRLIDVEYPLLHQFTFGSTHPYGFSSGVNVRVF